MKKLFFILLSIQMLFALEVQELKKGDVVEDSIERLEKKYYKVKINVEKSVKITLTNLDNDVDLYARTQKWLVSNARVYPLSMEKNLPTIQNNDSYSSNSGNTNEECNYKVLSQAKDDIQEYVYILVYGFKSSPYTLKVEEVSSYKSEGIGEKARKGNVKKDKNKRYWKYGEAGETYTVTLFNLSDDVDLRVKIGKEANHHTFDCKSINGGNKTDSCSVTLDKSLNHFIDKTIFIQVYGYKAAEYEIKIEKKKKELNKKRIN